MSTLNWKKNLKKDLIITGDPRSTKINETKQ